MNKLIIITGISGTGKTTVADMLYNKIDNSTSVSYEKLISNNINLGKVIDVKDIEKLDIWELINEIR